MYNFMSVLKKGKYKPTVFENRLLPEYMDFRKRKLKDCGETT
jgi:hypothetical protein